MKRFLLLALTAGLLTRIATKAEVDKTPTTKVTAELEKLKDSQFVDFGKNINKSVENTKKKESEAAKTFCEKTYEDAKSRRNCIDYLSPYGEAIDSVVIFLSFYFLS